MTDTEARVMGFHDCFSEELLDWSLSRLFDIRCQLIVWT